MLVTNVVAEVTVCEEEAIDGNTVKCLCVLCCIPTLEMKYSSIGIVKYVCVS